MKTKVYFTVVVCLTALRICAQDQSNQAAASKIVALESVWNQAEEHSDIRALDLIFDDALIYIDEDGSSLTKAQFLSRAKVKSAQLQSLVTQNTSVRVYGETALVVGSYRAKGVQQGKPYQHDGRFIDTWVLKNDTWVCVAAQATPVLR
jgi:ketosteroid isomerase-like protein